MDRGRLGVTLWLMAIMVGVLAVYTPVAGAVPAQQPFDAAATVTALVQTREAIIALLTRTPETQAAAITTNQTKASPPTAPTVTIKVRGLNVRSGPGTNYPVVASVNAGQTLIIRSGAANCSWLQIADGERELGWISGSSQYVTFTSACSTLPQGTIPAAPTPQPTPQPTPTAQPAANPPSSAVGCYVLLNQLAFELTITLSRSDGWRDSFGLGVNAEKEYCAPPGDYQYSLQAPGALGAIQGTLTIKAGERYRLPLKLGN